MNLSCGYLYTNSPVRGITIKSRKGSGFSVVWRQSNYKQVSQISTRRIHTACMVLYSGKKCLSAISLVVYPELYTQCNNGPRHVSLCRLVSTVPPLLCIFPKREILTYTSLFYKIAPIKLALVHISLEGEFVGNNRVFYYIWSFCLLNNAFAAFPMGSVNMLMPYTTIWNNPCSKSLGFLCFPCTSAFVRNLQMPH